MLHMKLEYRSGFLFVLLEGILNRNSSYKINKYLLPTIIKQNIKNLVLDLNNITGLDETGIDAILNTRTAVHLNKGNFYIDANDKNIKNTFKKLHIKEYLHEA